MVTHPEATHHTDRLVGGWYDSALTERGRRQAHAIAERLAAVIPTGSALAIRSSDLQRARTTADVIGTRLGAEVVLDRDLREKSYGEAEGRPQSWLDERFVPPPASGDRLRHDEGIAGAETRWDLALRARAAMARIEESASEHVVVVSHGGTTTFLLAAWIGMPPETTGVVSFRLTPGGITLLRTDDRFHSRRIEELNHVGHLRGI